jgi:NADH-quinone oxidoreductase subunit M
VILAAVYLLWMFQNVFMGPVDNEETWSLRDLNRRELAIMLAFILFIFWIGIAPSGFFALIDTSVQALVSNISASIVAMPVP